MKGINEKERKKRYRKRKGSLNKVSQYIIEVGAIEKAGGRVEKIFVNRRSILRNAFVEAKKGTIKRMQKEGLPRAFARKNVMYTFKDFIGQIIKMQKETVKRSKKREA